MKKWLSTAATVLLGVMLGQSAAQASGAFDVGASGAVNAVVAQSDGRLVIGGSFDAVGNVPRGHLARLDADGVVDPGFDPGADGNVSAIALQSDGKLIVVGNFATVGGAAFPGVARLNADGSVDTGFAPVAVTGAFQTMVVQADDKIVLGGNFNAINGQPRGYIARLGADGTLDTGFATGAGPDYYLTHIALAADGSFYAVGAFNSYDGQPHVKMAHINADGSADAAFAPSIVGTPQRVLVQGDGAVVIAGSITSVNGQSRSRLARFAPDGTLDAFQHSFDSVVYGLGLQPDGDLLVGGQFSQVDNIAYGGAVRFATDGTLDASFVNPQASGRVVAFVTQASGKIVIGGNFSMVGGANVPYLARLNADGTLDVTRYVVTPIVSGQGTLTPSTPQAVVLGTVVQFTVTPDAGNYLVGIDGCGGTLSQNVFTTAPIDADCTVNAQFAPGQATYTVTPNAGAHGTLTPSTPQQIANGATAQFTATADAGYYLDLLEGCGGTRSGNLLISAPVYADCAVSASFVTPGVLDVVAGGAQTAAVGTAFRLPLAVRVRDANGRPVAGAEVAYAAPASGASATLSAVSAVSDAAGIAQVNAVANGTVGSYEVTVHVGGIGAAFALANVAASSDSGLTLAVTLSTDPPPACGTATSLDVPAGTPVNYCFTVTNHGNATLNYHTLSFDPIGAPYVPSPGWDNLAYFLFYLDEQPLAAGASLQYNHVISAGVGDQAPRFTWSAFADLPNYAPYANADVPFVDISASGLPLNLVNGTTYDLSLPFAFTHFGLTFNVRSEDRLCINNPGNLQFHRGACPTPDSLGLPPPLMGNNQPLDHGASPDLYNVVAPYWDLLGDDGQIYVETLGEAPNRQLVVQWDHKDSFGFPPVGDGVTFEAIFDEALQSITYVYRDLAFGTDVTLDDGGSATVGMSDNSRELYQQHSYNVASLHEGQAIAYSPTTAAQVATSGVRLHVATPRIQVAPAALAATAVAGTSTSRNLGIDNLGNLALSWTLDRTASTAHFPLQPRVVAPVGDPDHPDMPPPAASATASASAPAATADTALAFEVPAFGVKLEATNWGSRIYAVDFDAAQPNYFVHVTPAIAYGEMYAGDFIDDDFSREIVFGGTVEFSLAWLDTATGDLAVFATSAPVGYDQPPYPRWNGLAWDRTTRTLYASTGNELPWCTGVASSQLYTIDPATGHASLVGPIATGGPVCISDIAVAPDGLLYGLDIYNDALVAIDKTTGTAAPIGSIGFDAIYTNSIDFDDATGVLYLAAYQMQAPANGGIYTLDLVTGAATRIAPFPTLPDNYGYTLLNALAIARPGGECARPGEVPWLSFSSSSGVTAPDDSSVVSVGFDASALEPGAYTANVCVSSDDRAHSLVSVPVSFTVSAEITDRVFGDGFDSAP